MRTGKRHDLTPECRPAYWLADATARQKTAESVKLTGPSESRLEFNNLRFVFLVKANFVDLQAEVFPNLDGLAQAIHLVVDI